MTTPDVTAPALRPSAGNVLIVYWGRKGLSRFALDFSKAVDDAAPLVSVSRTNEVYPAFAAAFADRLVPVTTFSRDTDAVCASWRIASLRTQMRSVLRDRRISTVIDLMPHVWMPLVLPVVRKSGARYIAVVHDMEIHPGDVRSRLAKWPMQRCFAQADHVVALSQTVARQLTEAGIASEPHLTTLFHPDLFFGTSSTENRKSRDPSAPMRIAFFGRILPYKGLSLFVDAVERLRADGVNVQCGVFGEGQIGAEASRLHALGAEVVNRWIKEDEVAETLGRYDALVASHVEASQSGVVAAALGLGMPAVATPVGDLVRQIEDGVTGVLAKAASAEALADAVVRLHSTPGLYRRIRSEIAERKAGRSMDRFANAVLGLAGLP